MKKIIIDGKEMSAKEVLSTKNTREAYYEARTLGLLESEAEEKAEMAKDKKFGELDMIEQFLESDRIDTFFINAYLENAESDLVIESAEVHEAYENRFHRDDLWALD